MTRDMRDASHEEKLAHIKNTLGDFQWQAIDACVDLSLDTLYKTAQMQERLGNGMKDESNPWRRFW